ncbi:F-box only protein 11 [Exaiptasia diaphana]|uniref:F-box only protein 11 n=1 Tax=Exaiptasia diaphana TaxID=2652724 RepID=A0A913X6Q3_EXADI|nr:F-box only protein 11 [Exaiptasia diaphana]KXJ14961.1 F-box only protein 11 [Exaiptasia diaphana]
MSSPVKRARVCTDFYRATKTRSASTKTSKCDNGPKKKERISKRLQSKNAKKPCDRSPRNVRKTAFGDPQQPTLKKTHNLKKSFEVKANKITAHFPRCKPSNGYCHVKAAPDELLLQIFSFLQADDLCRVSQVCTRFATICQDETLWKQLYSRVFDMRKPLRRTEEGLIVSQDSIGTLSWKESFKMLHNSHHVYQNNCFQENNILHHKTVQDAIDSVPANGFILVHAGTYKESLVINKPVFIIGVSFGDINAVTIESSVVTTVNFESGSSGALLGHLTVKHTVNQSSQYSKHGCLEISGECSPVIFNCRLTSLSHAGATVYVHGKTARPVVSNCVISDSENVGIFVTDGAQGLYEDCEITNTKLAGVWVRSHANPIMRRNHVHHGRDVGFFIFDQGLGYYEKNDIHHNRIAGLEVRSWANPTVVGCLIHHGMTGGIYCHDDARGEFLENKIYSNKYAGIWITSQSNPTIKNNEIFDGQQGGVYVFGEGRGLIESNNIHDNALAGIQIRTKSNPIVRCNRIHSGLHGGIYIHEGGQGLIEENEIFSNTLAGVWITTGSSPTLRYNRIHSGKQVGVYFYDGGCGTLEDNDIFNHKYSGIQIRSNSNPLIRRNKIWGGQNGGVLVYNEGMGLLEENEIFDNAMAGVWIKTDSNPVLRKNKIHDGREGGICIFNGGKGVLEENEIFRNTLTGVLISTSSFPVLKNNRIYDGGAAGIEITNNAGGLLEDNEVFNNRFDGICLATGVKPKLKNNKVYSNKGEVEHAVDGGLCLFQVSGNSCYPMHDFYKCNTCGTTDGFAICISCVNKCHRGHNISFVRHDRFFCDCGAGSTGINCKLTGESSRSVTSCKSRHTHNSCNADGAEGMHSDNSSIIS